VAILAVNSVLQWDSGDESPPTCARVLWIDRRKNEIVLFFLSNESDNHSLPIIRKLSDIQEDILENLAIIRPIDPYERRIDHNDERVKKHIGKRDELWEINGKYLEDEPDIYDPKLRGIIIREIIDKGLATKKTIYRVFRKYWKYGKSKDALLPLFEKFGAPGKTRDITDEMIALAEERGEELPKRGRERELLKVDPMKKGINIDESTKKLILTSIERHFRTTKKPTLVSAYRKMLSENYSIGTRIVDGVPVPILDPEERYPSLGQFKYVYYNNQDIRKTLIKREGRNRFNLSNRAVLGSSTENELLGPGSVYQIDATVASVHLVNRYDRTRNVGKPTVYFVMDVVTRKIVGFYVSLNDPSWIAVQMALFDAFSNVGNYSEVTNLLEKYCYLPEVIVWDRGKENLGFDSDNLPDALDIQMKTTASYRADWKGIIEQMFNQLREKIRNLPGAVKKGYKERGEKDHRLETVLDIEQFTNIVKDIVERHNNHYMKDYPLDEEMLHANVYPYPNDLWEWGIENRGALRQESPLKVMFHLMSKKTAVVTHRGIRLGKAHYTCSRADKERWFERARANGSWKISVAFNKRDTQYIYLLLDSGQTIERCTLIERDKKYLKYHVEEIEDVSKREKVKADLNNRDELQSDIILDAKIEAEVASAKAMTEDEHLEKGENSRRKKIKDVNESRAEEKERIQKQESWLLGEKPTNIVDVEEDEHEEEEELEPTHSPYQSMLKKLKNL
jgi:putative transposase